MPTTKQTASVSHSLKVGNILVASWGYDQTNIDFFEVVAVLPKSIKLVMIDKRQLDNNGPCVRVVPIPGTRHPHYDQIVTRRVIRGRVAYDSCRTATLWNGLPENETGWGYGH